MFSRLQLGMQLCLQRRLHRFKFFQNYSHVFRVRRQRLAYRIDLVRYSQMV